MQGFADFFDSLLGGAMLLGLSLAVGGVVWGLVVLRPGGRSAGDPAVRRCLALVGGGAMGLALCQATKVLLKALVLGEYLGPGAFARFAATVQFRAGAARALLALAVAITAAWVARRPQALARWAVAVALASLLVLSGAWLVHAAGRFEERVPLMALTVVHQVGAAVWVGGLVQLGALWRLARRDAAVGAAWPVLAARFSRVAVGALVVLLVPAVPLAWMYVGSWAGFIGTGYGSMVLTKVALLGVVLLLGAFNFAATRGRAASGAVRTRLPFLVEAETLLLVALLFTAASLSSQPPSVDTPGDRATWDEVVEVFRPKWPSLETPSVEVKRLASADPFAVVGWERTPEAYRWSNFSHNVAGLVVLAMSAVALAGWAARRGWVLHWLLGFLALAVFVFLRASASDGTWPFGSPPPWSGDAEGFQHRVAALLALTLGLVEWRARAARPPGRVVPYLFPALAAAGGILLLTHSHTAFQAKSSFLVQVTHTTMGALAVAMACGRLLELRLPAAGGRLAGGASAVAMLLVALVLVFYREANVALPPAEAGARLSAATTVP